MEGTQLRYFEDVEPGDELGPVEKLPSDEAVVAFCQVWGNPMPNRFTDDKVARDLRLPGPIVPGIMLMAYMAQLLTEWAPNGALKKLDVVFRQVVLHQAVKVTGVVTDKRAEGEEKLVELDLYLTSQEGERMVGGKAILALPGR